MKRLIIPFCIVFASCGGGSQSAEDIAQEWCGLNKKEHEAKDEAERKTAHDARMKFEEEVEDKYKNDEEFMQKVELEMEKCEGESEGVKDYDGD